MPRREGLAGAYARFRGSMLFMASLAGVVAFWIIWNSIPGLPHFDAGEFGRLNVFLSVEASLSVALLIMDSARQEERQRIEQNKQQLYTLAMLEAMRDTLKRIEPDVLAGVGVSRPPAGVRVGVDDQARAS